MRDRKAGLDWLYFDGGPMVLLPNELLPHWKGYVPSGEDAGSPADLSDYGRACRVHYPVGPIDVGPGQGLVVSVEEAQTGWHPVSPTEGLLVEWGYAEGEQAVADALANLPDDLWKDTGLRLALPGGRATLLGSASRGRDVPPPPDDDRMELRLAPGTYSVATADYKPDDHTWLLLHRIRPV